MRKKTHPSWLTNGFNVCGSMRTLPLGTLAISVTAHTIPEGTDCIGSGVCDPLPILGDGVTELSERCDWDCVLYLNYSWKIKTKNFKNYFQFGKKEIT